MVRRLLPIKSFVLFLGLVSILSIALASTISSSASAAYYDTGENCATRGGSWTAVPRGGGLCTLGGGILNATPPTYDMDKRIKSLLYYRIIGACFMKGTLNGPVNNTLESPGSKAWWTGGEVPAGAYLKGISGLKDNGKLDCKDTTALNNAARSLWSIEYDNWLCAAGWLRIDVMQDSSINSDANAAAQRCTNEAGGGSVDDWFGYYELDPYGTNTYTQYSSWGNPALNDGPINKTLGVIRDRIYGGNEPEFSTNMIYPFYRQVFFTTCAGGQNWLTGGTDTRPARMLDNEFSVEIVTSATEKTTRYFSYSGGGSPSKSVLTRPGGWPDFVEVNKTCAEMLSYINDQTNITAFQTYLSWWQGQTGLEDQSSQTPIPSDDETSGTTCVIDGVGWFVCSATKFMADSADWMYSIIENFFKTQPLNIDTSSGNNGIYNAWSIMRDFANVAFVIVFLIIVFSQLTGIGVNNMGVKKVLPRLIVGAILVNLSFWISAIAVDVSNILGKGVGDVLVGVRDNLNIGISKNWGNIVAALLAGGAIALQGGVIVTGATALAVFASTEMGSEVWIALAFLVIPIILAAVLAIITAVLVLVARQALIVLLIVISPLAFVAMLLPNTEKWFTKWRQLFTSLLLFYPIMSFIFAGSQLAGMIIMASADGGGTVGAIDPLGSGIAILTGQLVIVLPFFFLIPLIFKFSGGGLDRLASQMLSRGQRMISGVSGMSRKAGMKSLGRGWERAKYGSKSGVIGSAGRRWDQYQARKRRADSYYKEQAEEHEVHRLATDEKYATAVAGGNREVGQRLARNAKVKLENIEITKARELLDDEMAQVRAGKHPAGHKSVDDFLVDRAKTGETTAIRRAAMRELASQSRVDQLRDLKKHFTTTSPGTDDLTHLEEAIQSNAPGISAKATDLVKGPDAAFKSFTGTDMAGWTEGTAKAFMQHLEELHKTGRTAEAQQLIDAYTAASEDIKRDPQLQGRFSADAGRGIKDMAAGSTIPGIDRLIASIGPDNKIR